MHSVPLGLIETRRHFAKEFDSIPRDKTHADKEATAAAEAEVTPPSDDPLERTQACELFPRVPSVSHIVHKLLFLKSEEYSFQLEDF